MVHLLNLRYVLRRIRNTTILPKKEKVKSNIALNQANFFEFDNSVQIPFLNEIYLRIFGEKQDGILIEVGAYDGITCSNVSGLIKRGWTALLIEPVPTFVEMIRNNYQNYQNVHILQKAMSSQVGTARIHLGGALSTLNEQLLHEYRKVSWSSPSFVLNESIIIETSTLDIELPEFLRGNKIDVMVIDVEGLEEKVFEGFDVRQYIPTVLIVELSDFHPNLLTTSNSSAKLYSSLLDLDYIVVYKDSINTIFIQRNTYKKLFNFDSHE